ncbi:RidA family protein [Devosia sp.]|uniref:RidA family protein n=1 Tax=Devosia sp. TaxID=1871048 RepID=UPI002EFD8D43
MTTREPNGGPVPQGRYLPACRHGGLIFTAGMTPRRDGVLTLTGPVRTALPIETYREAVVLACSNALSAASGVLAAGEGIAAILSLTVYVAAESDFTAHSRLADFASQHLQEALGERGIGARAAVGVATLPGNAPVEVQIIAAIS